MRPPLVVRLMVLVLLPGMPLPAHAQIAAGRPGFQEGTALVPRGLVQVEAGAGGTRMGSGQGRVTTFGFPTIVRVGVTDRLELRAGSDVWTRTRTPTGTSDGVADVSIGAAMQVAPAREGRAEIALIAVLDLPSGAEAVQRSGVRPRLLLPMAWSLPGGVAVSLMPGGMLDQEGDDRFLSAVLAGGASVGLGGGVGGFVELAGESLPLQSRRPKVITARTGATLLVAPELQLDVEVAAGLNRATPDLLWSTGVSVRF